MKQSLVDSLASATAFLTGRIRDAGRANWLARLGVSPLGVRAIKHLVSPLQRWLYRISAGRIFASVGPGRNVLLLTTQGRRTGIARTIPVFYIRAGESIIICNVNPKFERINPWVLNLRDNPVAQLQIGSESGLYRARQATDSEVDLYWPRLVALWSPYQHHYDNGGRRSIFILEKS